MAKDKKTEEQPSAGEVPVIPPSTVEEAQAAQKAESKVEAKAPPGPTDDEILAARKAPVNAALPVSFDRWFATQERPDHHKHGMRAYASTAGKKTIAQWDAVFEKY